MVDIDHSETQSHTAAEEGASIRGAVTALRWRMDWRGALRRALHNGFTVP